MDVCGRGIMRPNRGDLFGEQNIRGIGEQKLQQLRTSLIASAQDDDLSEMMFGPRRCVESRYARCRQGRQNTPEITPYRGGRGGFLHTLDSSTEHM